MTTKVGSVLVTGTTSGVGKALLEHYVQRGARVIAVNRRQCPELAARYPRVRFECVDVQREEAVSALIRNLVANDELPEVFVLNAGINRVDNDECFELPAYKAVIDTNLYGVLHFVGPLTQLPRGRAPRRVVAISSMASYVGNPYALGYTTSKLALSACFKAWARMYAETDLRFQQVMLGPVDSEMFAMHESFPAWMVRIKQWFSVPLGGTALAIARFALTDKARLFHPWRALPLYMAMWALRSFVPGFFQGRKTRAGAARRLSRLADAGCDSTGAR